MDLKDYQRRTLAAFDRWRRALEDAREETRVRAEALRGVGMPPSEHDLDYPGRAWRKLREAGESGAARPHVDRSDGVGRPIPHVCFKIPTGGGKTLLGAAALERLKEQTGLVLWLMPTRAIYQQTRAAFWNKGHPYRQRLEWASGGRVKLLEKEDSISADDLRSHFCLMLLMLPAANRQKGREFLRMFRDSGRYPTLFPDSDDERGNDDLLERFPDLDRSEEGIAVQSLFNVFKMHRPVVVLDEAHKAYGGKGAGEFVRSVNRLDPRLVIELSATPNAQISNLLMDVSGLDLKQEEMIKLPVEVTSLRAVGWRETLGVAHGTLEELEAEARSLENAEGRYIRPIAVVRVERTGRDQRDGTRVHAEDVRDYLIRNLGEGPDAVRVKSSTHDEIRGENLLSPLSPVRWIITKAALMEGWDCSFAYLLVMLDNTRSDLALTQLLGRVIRQPYARRTGRERLDRCYVHCWQTEVGHAIRQVKGGLEREGLSGLGDEVTTPGVDPTKRITVRRQDLWRGKDLFLPKVLHRDGDGGWRDLDYQRHILPGIPWGALEPELASEIPGMRDGAVAEVVTVDLGDGDSGGVRRTALEVDTTITVEWFVRQLSDLIPNPWQAVRLTESLIERLRERLRAHDLGDDEFYAQRRAQMFVLRRGLVKQIERRAQRVFRDKLKAGEIRFDLVASEPNFRVFENFETEQAPGDHTLEEGPGRPAQKSLFEPQLERDYNALEKKFAFYLDQQEAIEWWHRVAVRQQHDYYLRGWNPDRIWPDFVAMSNEPDGTRRLLVVETKGTHLEGNEDTEYKRGVFATLEEWLDREDTYECGEVRLERGAEKGVFRLVFHEEGFAEALA